MPIKKVSAQLLAIHSDLQGAEGDNMLEFKLTQVLSAAHDNFSFPLSQSLLNVKFPFPNGNFTSDWSKNESMPCRK